MVVTTAWRGRLPTPTPVDAYASTNMIRSPLAPGRGSRRTVDCGASTTTISTFASSDSRARPSVRRVAVSTSRPLGIELWTDPATRRSRERKQKQAAEEAEEKGPRERRAEEAEEQGQRERRAEEAEEQARRERRAEEAEEAEEQARRERRAEEAEEQARRERRAEEAEEQVRRELAEEQAAQVEETARPMATRESAGHDQEIA
jgi:hypothetical protein